MKKIRNTLLLGLLAGSLSVISSGNTPASAYQAGCNPAHTHYISEAYTTVSDYWQGDYEVPEIHYQTRLWHSNGYIQDYGSPVWCG